MTTCAWTCTSPAASWMSSACTGMRQRLLVAECKAHKKEMGGDAINKFLGALTRERDKQKPKPVSGYFVSLGGFTQTAIEQELESGPERVTLLDAQGMIAELERSHILIPRVAAIERAVAAPQAPGLHGGARWRGFAGPRTWLCLGCLLCYWQGAHTSGPDSRRWHGPCRRRGARGRRRRPRIWRQPAYVALSCTIARSA